MAIIKLTLAEEEIDPETKEKLQAENRPIWINTRYINGFFNGEKCTVLENIYGTGIRIKETPEEILSLIKEAENGK